MPYGRYDPMPPPEALTVPSTLVCLRFLDLRSHGDCRAPRIIPWEVIARLPELQHLRVDELTAGVCALAACTSLSHMTFSGIGWSPLDEPPELRPLRSVTRLSAFCVHEDCMVVCLPLFPNVTHMLLMHAPMDALAAHTPRLEDFFL